jgi:hypothetical protein
LLTVEVDMAGRTTFGQQWITVVALVLAVATGLVSPCFCSTPEPDHKGAAKHACCAPKAGLLAAQPSCCPDGHETAAPAWTAVPPLTLESPASVAALDVPALAAPAVAPSLPPTRPVSASPPLRI